MDPPPEQMITDFHDDDIHSSPNTKGSIKDDTKWTVPREAAPLPVPTGSRQIFSDIISSPHSFVFQMDLLSPSKNLEALMENSPCNKMPYSNKSTGLTPGFSELQPSKAKRLKRSESPLLEAHNPEELPLDVDSPMRRRKLPKCKTESNIQDKTSVESSFALPLLPKALFAHKVKGSTSEPSNRPQKITPHKSELKPCKLFSDSAKPSSSNFEAMLDEIQVTPLEDDGSEDFLRRQKNHNLRKCRSFDLRKHFADIGNTPTSSFKCFKKPKTRDSSEMSVEINENKSCDNDNEDEVNESDHERIKNAVDALQSSSLIADGSRSYCLPVIPGKHSDLKNIHHDTLANLLMVPSLPFNNIEKFTVIDCRYPYEYRGGHIKGAINIYTEDVMTEFLKDEFEKPSSDSGKHVLVFHCEFSSQRGPSLLRHLRNDDRKLNAKNYPKLTFPEMYCLFGGYKEFFQKHKDLCEPPSYVPMNDEKYANDLRHFRAKAKSWAAGERLKSLQNV